MKIAIVAAEIGPFAKAGGLADVIGALPQALVRQGADASVIVPAYRPLIQKLTTTVAADGLSLAMGADREPYRILRADGAGGVPLYLIDHPGFFDRDGIYGDDGGVYPDNNRRYRRRRTDAPRSPPRARLARRPRRHRHPRRDRLARALRLDPLRLHDSQRRLPGHRPAGGVSAARPRRHLADARVFGV